MKIQRTWSVTGLDCRPNDGGRSNVVARIHWRLDAKAKDAASFAEGTADLAPPEGEDFVPFDALTEAQAIAWLHAAMGEAAVAAYIDYVDRQIAEQVQPAIVTLSPPWAKPAEAEAKEA